MKATALLALAALAAGGCRGRTTAKAAAATVSANEPWSCGGVHGEAKGVRALGRDGRVKLGAIADLHGDRAAAAQAAARLAGEQVDAIAALGDLGATEEAIAGVLTELGRGGRPLLALAGDEEQEGRFHDAVKRARAAGVDVIDMLDLRVMDIGAVELVSAPGYRYSLRGCHYDERDLQQLKAFVGAAHKPIVLMAHAPPRDEGADGVDRGFGDANVGDPALRELATTLRPLAALCAHVDEAGGRRRAPWVNIGTRPAIVEVVRGRAETRVLP